MVLCSSNGRIFVSMSWWLLAIRFASTSTEVCGSLLRHTRNCFNQKDGLARFATLPYEKPSSKNMSQMYYCGGNNLTELGIVISPTTLSTKQATRLCVLTTPTATREQNGRLLSNLDLRSSPQLPSLFTHHTLFFLCLATCRISLQITAVLGALAEDGHDIPKVRLCVTPSALHLPSPSQSFICCISSGR